MQYEITDPLTEGTFELAIEVNKFFESLVLFAYPDPGTGGEPFTIGYGATQYEDGWDVRQGQKISERYANQLLSVKVIRNWAELCRIPMWHKFTGMQQAALLSFSINNGSYFYGNPNYETITEVLRGGVYEGMEAALQLYRNPKTNVELGLWRRRIAEVFLWKNNVNWRVAKSFSLNQCKSFTYENYMTGG